MHNNQVQKSLFYTTIICPKNSRMPYISGRREYPTHPPRGQYHFFCLLWLATYFKNKVGKICCLHPPTSGGSRKIIRRGFLLPLNNFSFYSHCIHIKKNYRRGLGGAPWISSGSRGQSPSRPTSRSAPTDHICVAMKAVGNEYKTVAVDMRFFPYLFICQMKC